VKPVVTSEAQAAGHPQPGAVFEELQGVGWGIAGEGVGGAGAAVGDIADHSCRGRPQSHLDRWAAVAQAVGGDLVPGQHGVLGRPSS
jgi:hypothetical protein